MYGEPLTASTMYFGEAPLSQTIAAAAFTIDWSLAHKQEIVLASSVTAVTFMNAPGVCNLMLAIIQNGVGGHGIAPSAWPVEAVWPGGTKPTFGNGPNALRLLSFYFDGVRYWSQFVPEDFG